MILNLADNTKSATSAQNYQKLGRVSMSDINIHPAVSFLKADTLTPI